jgi:hypothetical protein
MGPDCYARYVEPELRSLDRSDPASSEEGAQPA